MHCTVTACRAILPRSPTCSQYTEKAIWGDSEPNPGSTNGSFHFPQGIAFDGSGNFYVTDSYNNRVQKFDLQGNFITYIGASAPNFGSANGSFYYPQGVAVDGSGNFYVADNSNNRVQKFDSQGNFITYIGASAPSSSAANGSFHYPKAVAFDGSGNFYVADLGNNRVQKFDSQGNFITYIGASAPSSSSANGSFNSPYDVAVDGSGNVYVADLFNNRVQKFDSQGNFITYIGASAPSYSSANGSFNSPYGVAVDGSGNVYVSDTQNNRVQKFDSQGNFITYIGASAPSSSSANDSFSSPFGVAFDGSGNIYVADYGNNRVVVYDIPSPPPSPSPPSPSPPLSPSPPSPSPLSPSPSPPSPPSPSPPSPSPPKASPSPGVAPYPPPNSQVSRETLAASVTGIMAAAKATHYGCSQSDHLPSACEDLHYREHFRCRGARHHLYLLGSQCTERNQCRYGQVVRKGSGSTIQFLEIVPSVPLF